MEKTKAEWIPKAGDRVMVFGMSCQNILLDGHTGRLIDVVMPGSKWFDISIDGDHNTMNRVHRCQIRRLVKKEKPKPKFFLGRWRKVSQGMNDLIAFCPNGSFENLLPLLDIEGEVILIEYVK